MPHPGDLRGVGEATVHLNCIGACFIFLPGKPASSGRGEVQRLVWMTLFCFSLYDLHLLCADWVQSVVHEAPSPVPGGGPTCGRQAGIGQADKQGIHPEKLVQGQLLLCLMSIPPSHHAHGLSIHVKRLPEWILLHPNPTRLFFQPSQSLRSQRERDGESHTEHGC